MEVPNSVEAAPSVDVQTKESAPEKAAVDTEVKESLQPKQNSSSATNMDVTLIITIFVLLVLVIFNYMKWQAALNKLENLQSHVNRLETILETIAKHYDSKVKLN